MITAPLSQSLGPIAAPSLTILSAEGEPIARRGSIIAEPVDVTQLPPHVGLAFVAIEDRRFYYHSGLDPWGMGRALVRNTPWLVPRGPRRSPAARKTSFLSPDRTYVRRRRRHDRALARGALTRNQILAAIFPTSLFGDNITACAPPPPLFQRRAEEISPPRRRCWPRRQRAEPARAEPPPCRRRARSAWCSRPWSMPAHHHAQRAAVRPPASPSAARQFPTGTYFARLGLPERTISTTNLWPSASSHDAGGRPQRAAVRSCAARPSPAPGRFGRDASTAGWCRWSAAAICA